MTEANDAIRYRVLREYLEVARDRPREWTCWLALPCIPFRSQTVDPDELVDKLVEAWRERVADHSDEVRK